MKIRERLGSMGCSLTVSLFVGFILVAIAAGSIWPGIDRFAASRFVCSNGTFIIHQDTYSYRPGESDTMTTDYCVDLKSGVKQDVSFLTMLVSGLVYSGVIFLFGIIVPPVWGAFGRLKAARAS